MSRNVPVRIAVVSAALACVHSLLASTQAKDLARRVAGPRYRNGLYRGTYNGVSAALLGSFVLWEMRQPNRDLYRVRPPWSWLLRVGQAIFFVLSAWTVLEVGPGFTGLPQFLSLLLGKEPGAEPAAQGPVLDSEGEMKARGPFAVTRHPGNWLPFGVLLCSPRMTRNRATLMLLYIIYVVPGSMHEERRLKKAYGSAYERYKRRVPFFL